jgi:hypothetical protein
MKDKVKTRPPMLFENITVSKVYEINYVDQNYPCKCECHTNNSIVHFMPCCFDHSYSGPAICIAKDDEKELCAMAVSTIRYMVLHTSSVIRLLNKEPWFEVPSRMPQVAKEVMGNAKL